MANVLKTPKGFIVIVIGITVIALLIINVVSPL